MAKADLIFYLITALKRRAKRDGGILLQFLSCSGSPLREQKLFINRNIVLLFCPAL